MKKFITILLSVLLLFSFNIFGCGNEDNNDKLSIVCTIFPEYDWVKNIVGDSESVDITLLQTSGADMHNYQPSVKDIAKINKSNIFIYVGGESDSWAEEVLKANSNENRLAVSLFEVLKDDLLCIGHDDEYEHEEGEEHHHTHDEHVWLSLNNAKKCVDFIKDKICLIDKENGSVYEQNAKNYLNKLTELDNEYAKAVSLAKNKNFVFGDRFPFAYMFRDYNLNYFAAFSSCSAEAEASFETLLSLANKINELSLNNILYIDNNESGYGFSKTIKENTINKNQEILSINSMQSITLKDINNGTNYIDIFKENLLVLKKCMGVL